MIGGDNAAEQLKDVAHGVEHLHSTLGGAAGRFTQRQVGQVQQLLYAQAVEDTQGNTTVTPTVWPGKTKCHGCVAVVTQGNAHVCVCVCVCVCECVRVRARTVFELHHAIASSGTYNNNKNVLSECLTGADR